MVSFSGGGAPPIAGLSSDGHNGIVVAGGITAGDRNAVSRPTFHTLYGAVALQDTPGNNFDGDAVLTVTQNAPLLNGDAGEEAIIVIRGGDISLQDYSTPAVLVRQSVASAQDLLKVTAQSVNALEAGAAGTGASVLGGQVQSIAAAPSISHSGTNCVATFVRATDLRGKINLVLSSTGSAANAELCTVTFAVAYAAAPIIVVSALDDATATALPLGAFYVDQTTNPTTTFMVKCTSALAAGTYRCAYVILG